MAPKRILIADRDDHTRKILSYLLERNGYEIQAENNGLDAVSRVSSHQPVLIIMDINLPGMDGFDFLRIIRDHPAWHDIKIIILSAMDREVDIIKGLSFGADKYITKPFSNQMLIKTIATLLEI